MLTTITAIIALNIGFVIGTAWKGIFKREDDARIDSPRTIEDAARKAGV